MGCHLVGLTPEASLRVPEELHFRGERRTYGELDAYGAGGPTLCDARIDCQLGVAQRSGTECLHLHRLLVVDDHKLVGIVSRCDLQRAPGERVDAVMQPEVYVIGAGATLGEAAAAMRALDVGCLPVTREQRLVGMITRGDLIRAGLPAEAFA